MIRNSLILQLAAILFITSTGLLVLRELPTIEDRQLPTSIPSNSETLAPETTTEFKFYDFLKGNEIVTDKSNYTSTPKNSNLKHPTVLQIAAIKSKNSALDITRRLKLAGLESVQIVERESSKGLLYLVRTEPYRTYDSLKADMAIAEKLNFHPDKIKIK